jgi:hypothetical protein
MRVDLRHRAQENFSRFRAIALLAQDISQAVQSFGICHLVGCMTDF